MIIEKKGYSYNDLTIVPEVISDVSSRSECNPFIKENWLPIIASPMASVVNENNLQSFIDNGITPIVPRNIDLDRRKSLMNDKQWVALSLKEFEFCFITEANKRDLGKHYFICVDIANGHMKSLYLTCRDAKTLADKYGYILTIMTGNIANAETYKWISEFTYKDKNDKVHCVIDFIRVGIGGGSGCITTSNTSIHYPQASLIDECYNLKKNNMNYVYELPKIVADGGVRNYDHVIKALALGADYVMIGSVFSQCMESAGEKTYKTTTSKTSLSFNIEIYKDFEIDKNGNWSAYYADEYITALIEELQSWKYNERIASLKEKKFIGPISVKFFGMASSDGQKSISGEKTKTAEGITKYLPVLYTLNGWTKNMISYLRSAMSYCNITDVKCFTPTNVTVQVISNNTVNSINK